MNRNQITRDDFPAADGGYDRPSVDAHLEAVAALTGALEAEIKALEVERDALRRQAASGPVSGGPARVDPEPFADGNGPGPEETQPEAAGAERNERSDDEVSARLVATRLALEGTDREQIREQLSASYDLGDIDGLVDDVLERLG